MNSKVGFKNFLSTLHKYSSTKTRPFLKLYFHGNCTTNFNNMDEPNSLIDNEREMTQHDWCLNNWQQNKDYIMNSQDGCWTMSTRKSCLLIDSCAPITLKSRPMSFICGNFLENRKKWFKNPLSTFTFFIFAQIFSPHH